MIKLLLLLPLHSKKPLHKVLLPKFDDNFDIWRQLEHFKYDMNHTLDANENDQIAAAIAASLKETTAQSTFSKIPTTNSNSDDSDSEFFEENYSADSEDSNSVAPSSKNYAKLLVKEESVKTETNTAKVESEKSEKSEKCEDAGSSNGEIYLGKNLWRNGRNTPKNYIFWKYIVGRAPITPQGWMEVDFLDHELL